MMLVYTLQEILLKSFRILHQIYQKSESMSLVWVCVLNEKTYAFSFAKKNLCFSKGSWDVVNTFCMGSLVQVILMLLCIS